MDDSRRSTAPPKEPSGRVCTVCSDRANGYNFGVLTCESCKAFFRRNAAKYNDIKCPFSNSCQITSASRKFCQACRLNKCFTVGMKSDWLNDAKSKNTGKFKRKKPDVQMKVEVQEEEDEGENDKEENNDEGDEKISVSKALYDKLVHKATQRDHCICTCQCGFYPVTQRLTAFETIENVPTHDHSLTSSATHSPASNICSTPSTFDSSNYSTLHLNPSSNSNPNSNSNSIHQPQSSLSPSNYKMQFPMGADCSQAQMLSPFELGSQMMNQMGKMESRPGGPPSILSFFPPMPERPWTPVAENIPTIEAFPEVANSPPVDLMVKIHQKIGKYTGVLDPDELKLLEELHVLNEPLNAPLSKWYNPNKIDGVIRIIEEALRRIIGMACQLTLFRELHVDDRKNLLKCGFCELLIVRGVMAFNKGEQSWNHSFGVAGKMEVKIDLLKNPETKDHYEQHKKLLETFGDDIRNNESLMLLFNAIVIFHPHYCNLRDSNRVHNSQARYFRILHKILLFEYEPQRAELAYTNLLNQVVDLHRMNSTMLHIFYGLDIHQLDPLVRELCSFE